LCVGATFRFDGAGERANIISHVFTTSADSLKTSKKLASYVMVHVDGYFRISNGALS
jgi:hypothetical protein